MNSLFYKKFASRMQHMPVGLTGIALGLCGLCTALDTVLKMIVKTVQYNHYWISLPTMIIVFCILVFVVIKWCIHPSVFKYELHDPLLSSFIPTFSMSLMCVGGFIAGWQYGVDGIPPAQVVGAIVMIIALILQIIFIVLFTKNVIFKHKWFKEGVYSSWYIPYIGVCVISTFTCRFNENILPVWFFQVIWFYSLVVFLILFIYITYSLLFIKNRYNKLIYPSLVIYFAPPNLILAAFLQTFAIPSVSSFTNHYKEVIAFTFNNNVFINTLLILLTCIAIVATIILYFFSYRLFTKHKFSYLFASFSVPLAVGSQSILYLTNYLDKLNAMNFVNSANNIDSIIVGQLCNFFKYLGYIFTIITTILILLILVRFFINILSDLFTTKLDDKLHKSYVDNYYHEYNKFIHKQIKCTSKSKLV